MKRTAALWLMAVLGRLALAAEPAADKAVAALRDPNAGDAAWQSVLALGKPAVPELKKLLADASERLRAQAAVLLYRLGEAEALDALAALVESKDDAARKEAADALRAFVAAPLGTETGPPQADALARWKAWWQANRQQAVAVPPMGRLYASVLAADAKTGAVALSLTARHGAARGMLLTVRRGTEAVCSVEITHTEPACSLARVAEFGTRVPPQAGDAAFFIRR